MSTSRGNGARNYGASPIDWDSAIRLGLSGDLYPFVCNPDAVLDPDSTLNKLGKAPSAYYPNGLAHGFQDWPTRKTSAKQVREWKREADLGIFIPTRRLRALDIDVRDAAKAGAIVAAIYQNLGVASMPRRYRTGTGKCLLIFWLPADDRGDFYKKSFRTASDKPEGDPVEFLATGQGFAVVGTHKDGERYRWDNDLDCLPDADEIPALTREQFESLWASLIAQFAMPDSATHGNGSLRKDTADDAIKNDPVAVKFIDAGMVRSYRSDNGMNVHCPWQSEHSGDSGKTETTYWPPHTGGFADGGFDCKHEHCAKRKLADILEFFGLSDGDQITKEDFWCYLPEGNKFIFTPTGATWPAASVDARVPSIQLTPASDTTAEDMEAKPAKVKAGKGAPKKKRTHIPASVWLSQNRRVDQMVWTPGEPQVIRDRLASDGGWIPRTGTICYNLYRPPILAHGDAKEAGRWLDLVRRVFGVDAEHIIRWLAHRVQRPGDKINHALVLGGSQGIGKDTILEPVKQAVGPWNFGEVSPVTLLGQFNPYLKSVILRVSEARDLGESNRFAFYDHMKTYTAAPPDVLSCNEKHLKPYTVFNVVGVIITSNHKIDGIHLPADDRRHFVAWSELAKEDFAPDYWIGLWAWYATGGIGHVAAYLQTLDLTGFDPKAPPVKTAAFWAIVDANRAPEDAELADTIDRLNNPTVLTLRDLEAGAEHGLRAWLEDRKNRRIIPHRLEAVGYVSVRNDADKHDGHWKIGGRRQAVYGQKDLSMRDKIAAIQAIITAERSKPVVVTDFDGGEIERRQ